MKITIDLPDDLVREVKIRAVVEGQSVKALVASLLREALRRPSSTPDRRQRLSKSVTCDENGVPVIRCDPNAPATRMSPRQLLELEWQTQTDEDMKRAGLPL
jgi:plasmid stability protein